MVSDRRGEEEGASGVEGHGFGVVVCASGGAGVARRIGPWEEVSDLVGAPTDEVEPFEGEGGLGTVADEAFQIGPTRSRIGAP